MMLMVMVMVMMMMMMMVFDVCCTVALALSTDTVVGCVDTAHSNTNIIQHVMSMNYDRNSSADLCRHVLSFLTLLFLTAPKTGTPFVLPLSSCLKPSVRPPTEIHLYDSPNSQATYTMCKLTTVATILLSEFLS